ncbi:MAG TPA: carbohydrate kinase family protein [Patescibacteria group bacterium]|nr:carbohydrate kinase family protein [Patescibacteria group bacterium]
MEFDVVTVGGATVDLFLLIDPTNPSFKYNKDTNEVSFSLGEKVILDNAKILTGGNAGNVAIGLRKLGFKTALVAEIGSDEFSENVLFTLKKEGVDTSFVKKGTGDTSFSVILNYKEDRTIFTRKVEKDHDFSFDQIVTKWVYLTSLGNKWEDVYERVSYFVDSKKIKLAFNPGGAQIEKGITGISFLLKQTEVFIVNKEEAVKLVGEKEIKDLLFELKKQGPKIVVITDGKNGSFAIDDKGEVIHEEALRVRVISKTGAGDAYSSGFLGALIYDKPIKEAMGWGTKNAASELRRVGANSGTMTLEQIQK